MPRTLAVAGAFKGDDRDNPLCTIGPSDAGCTTKFLMEGTMPQSTTRYATVYPQSGERSLANLSYAPGAVERIGGRTWHRPFPPLRSFPIEGVSDMHTWYCTNTCGSCVSSMGLSSAPHSYFRLNTYNANVATTGRNCTRTESFGRCFMSQLFGGSLW